MMRVIGTAGHVDHGKSTLVRALTGIDPDRLQEEKARGMTIDLGFAWLKLKDRAGNVEDVGIVDVPGHIDFIKNMLAGIGGIDAVLLVIAADEGVMPQTREHLAIVDLLAIPTGVVVLTKVDAVDDPEWLDLVELDIVAQLEGSRLAGAPVVRVSALTGAGLDLLLTTLAKALEELPPRRYRGSPRLPVDRVFTLSGFGTVVTGTLLDGEMKVGENVEVLPSRLQARIRGLQTHRKQVERGAPGSRLAINLAGVDASELRRGDVVTRPGQLQPTRLLDARIRVLAGSGSSLRHNQSMDLFVGATDARARMRILGADRIEPGHEGWAQLDMEQAIVVVEGDRFILRLPSPSATVAGGIVINPAPGRKWRRFDEAALARLKIRAEGAPAERVLDTIAARAFSPREEIMARCGLTPEDADAAISQLHGAGSIVALGEAGDPFLVERGQWEQIIATLVAALSAYHRLLPLRGGMPRSEARSRLGALFKGEAPTPRLFGYIVDSLAASGGLIIDDEVVALAGFAPAPSAAQAGAIERAKSAFRAAPGAPPNRSDTLALLENDVELLEYLVSTGVLVRASGEVLFLREDYERMAEAVRTHLRTHDKITMAEARDLLSSSRKYVQALLEEMDARRITRRIGDERVLR